MTSPLIDGSYKSEPFQQKKDAEKQATQLAFDAHATKLTEASEAVAKKRSLATAGCG